MITRTSQPANGALLLSEMKEFGGFSKATQRYIRRSLDIGLERPLPVGVEELKAAGVVRRKDNLVKILGNGEIGRAVTVWAHAFSKTAEEKIEAAGGSVVVLER